MARLLQLLPALLLMSVMTIGMESATWTLLYCLNPTLSRRHCCLVQNSIMLGSSDLANLGLLPVQDGFEIMQGLIHVEKLHSAFTFAVVGINKDHSRDFLTESIGSFTASLALAQKPLLPQLHIHLTSHFPLTSTNLRIPSSKCLLHFEQPHIPSLLCEQPG